MALALWDRRSRGRYGRLSLALFALAFGLLTLSRARHDPGGSFAGVSTLGAVAELAAGWTLVASGLCFWELHRGRRFGLLVVAAGFAWFVPEWINPGVGTSVGYTAGLIAAVACPPLLGHASLSYPSGRLKSLAERATLAVSYAGGLLLLGVLPTIVFDPRGSGCNQCSRNLALVHGDAGLNATFAHYGLRIGLGWLAALCVLLGWRLARASQTGTLLPVPVLVPAVAYLGLVLWDFHHDLSAEVILGNDSSDVRAWRYEALALVLFALSVGWGLYRERRTRAAVAELVVELGNAPRPAALRDALADALRDPALELAYRRPNSEKYVNAAGLPVAVAPGPEQSVTPLLRGDTPVAALIHHSRLNDQPGLIEEVVSAARLALQNEQLQAEARAQMADLRASRARIVEAADAERRRLERDLHDGAQQRMVALSLALQLLRSKLGSEANAELAGRIAAAQAKLGEALAELRELAHGIYPAVLSDEGLAAAIEVLVEQAEIPIRLEGLTQTRFQTAVENAAYFTVVEAIRTASEASISIEQDEGRLVVSVRSSPNGAEPDRLAIVDRVGALDGSVTVVADEIRAEIPCGS